ncbi:MAG: ABC transporter permease [Sterolibacterium sp.]|jgi:lipopolysaccharide transport system permease protein|nr:ABC transporter permease [Sterolibacterium sp.]
MLDLARAAWGYRGFILGSVQREFQARYRNSMLGAVWVVLNPLAMIAVYTLVFSQLMKARLPGVDSEFAYSIYLCAGIFAWGLFAEITTRAQTMFLDNANLLKKLSFPRICLPIIVVISATLNFAIIFGLFSGFLLLSGHFPGLVYVAVLPLLLLQTAFAIGLGMTLGVLNVFFRDVGQFFGILLQFWFWLTPIVYSATIVPPTARPLLELNPLTALITAWQGIFVNAAWPHWSSLLPLSLLTLLLCSAGLLLFRRRAGELVDEL